LLNLALALNNAHTIARNINRSGASAPCYRTHATSESSPQLGELTHRPESCKPKSLVKQGNAA
jgi:hypothetical protein